MTTQNAFKYFKTSPEIIRLAVMYYVRYPLSFRQVEDILHERAMQKFKSPAALQKFTSYHAQIYNHFNHERHLETRQSFKRKRATALTEWFNFCAA